MKINDDLRRDQFIMHMLVLVDSIFKKEGLDLCLLPYNVVPFTKDDGIVECIPNSETLQDILKTYGSIESFLMKTKQEKDEIEEKFNVFARSCAGTTIFSYVLGIGDRHLENIMINEDGYMVHIDFGFIFGAEPPAKSNLATSLRFTKEMYMALGESK